MKLNFKTQSNKLGKQCKERWFNHLNPNLNKKIWTKPEDIELLESAIVHNKKWSKIVQFFSGRNQHSLKNRFIRLIAREQRVSIKKITIKENCSNAIISDTLATLRKLDRASETVETKTNIDLQNSNNGDKEVSNILKTPLLMENTSPNNSPLEFPFSFREVSPLRSSDFSIDDFLRISDFKGYLFDCE